MNWWPFPLLRIYPTDQRLTDLFNRFLECPDLRVRYESPDADPYYAFAVCNLGTMRFWCAGRWYAWASRGEFSSATDVAHNLSWDQAMPNRWTVRCMAARLPPLNPKHMRVLEGANARVSSIGSKESGA